MDDCREPVGCKPYFVSIQDRICELCDAIKNYSAVPGKNDKVALWCKEILMLNEADRSLRYEEQRKVWVEDGRGQLHQI